MIMTTVMNGLPQYYQDACAMAETVQQTYPNATPIECMVAALMLWKRDTGRSLVRVSDMRTTANAIGLECSGTQVRDAAAWAAHAYSELSAMVVR